MRIVVAVLVLVIAVLVADRLLQESPPNARADGTAALNGDVNGDSSRDIGDAIYLLTYLFRSGPAPVAIADSPEVLGRLDALEDAVVSLQSAVGTADAVSAAFSRLAALLDPNDAEPVPPVGTLRLAGCPEPRQPVFSLFVGGSALGEVIGFVGREEVSSLYEYEVAITTGLLTLEPSAFIGKKAYVSFRRNAGTALFSGEIGGFARAASTGTEAVYVMRIVPLAARMTRHVGYGVWQQMTISDVITAYFADHGVALGTVPSSPLRMPYLLQYNESDWAFVSRLMEEDGIFYFFTHATGGETLMGGGANDAFPAAVTLPYHGHLAERPAAGEEYIRTFRVGADAAIKSVRLCDFDYVAKAQLSATMSQAGGSGDVTELGAFGISQQAVVRQTELALKRRLLQASQVTGTGNSPAIRAGQRITLDDRAGGGFAGTYVVTSVRHMAVVAEVAGERCCYYGNEFTAVSAALAYAPPRRTPIPLITAPLPAVVTDNYDHDKLGRVKVKLVGEGNAQSFWARVATPFAGRDRGAFFLPEVDDEVVVAFMHGDLRRPIVIGSVWNGVDKPPAIDSLDAHNNLRLISSRAGQVLAFDDTAGEEKIEVATPSGGILLTAGDILLTAGTTRVTGALTSSSSAGPDGVVAPGDRYQDNSIVAWAFVQPDGSVDGSEFGVERVTRNAAGNYTVVVDAKAAHATQLIPLVTGAVVSGLPPARELHVVSVRPASADTFSVYISDGTAYVDGAFVFMATARGPAR